MSLNLSNLSFKTFKKTLPKSLLFFAATFFIFNSLSSFANNLEEANASSLDAAGLDITEDLPEVMEHLQNKGLVINNTFNLGTSLKGWVVSYQGQEQIIYTTANGEFLINGLVLDLQGNDLTQQHQKTWLSKVTWQDLNEASFISNKKPEATKVIYVFFDANCPFSQLAWLALQPYVEIGLEVRWLPVAYLQPSSKKKAASLLNSPKVSQEEMLAQLMQPKNQVEQDFDSYTPENLNQLEANTQLMQSLGLNATPAWVWLNEADELESFAGMLRLPKIAEITGLPKQKHPQSSLTRFR